MELVAVRTFKVGNESISIMGDRQEECYAALVGELIRRGIVTVEDFEFLPYLSETDEFPIVLTPSQVEYLRALKEDWPSAEHTVSPGVVPSALHHTSQMSEVSPLRESEVRDMSGPEEKVVLEECGYRHGQDCLLEEKPCPCVSGKGCIGFSIDDLRPYRK